MIYGWIGASHQLGASMAAFGAGAIRTSSGDYQLAFLIAGYPVRPRGHVVRDRGAAGVASSARPGLTAVRGYLQWPSTIVPAVLLVHPAARHPDRTGARRDGPAAGDPDVGPAVPPLVTIDPDVLRPRGHGPYLDDRSGRADLDVYTCGGIGRGAADTDAHADEQREQQTLRPARAHSSSSQPLYWMRQAGPAEWFISSGRRADPIGSDRIGRGAPAGSSGENGRVRRTVIERRRVVVTGVGLVSSGRRRHQETWTGRPGRTQSGIGPITLFDTARHSTRIAGEVKGFDPLALAGQEGRQEVRRASSSSRLPQRAMAMEQQRLAIDA